MLQSMTGFGNASCELPDKTVNVEIRSLNGKTLDLYVRLPHQYRDKEIDIRNDLTARLKRGKVEVVFNIEYKDEKQPSLINTGAVKSYYNQIRKVLEELGVPAAQEPILQAVMRLPEVLNNGKQSLDPEEWEIVKHTLMRALEAFDNFRSQEGKTIAGDVLMRLGLIESFLGQIEPFEKERHDGIRRKLMNSLRECFQQENHDMNRYEQEMIYYLEKLDITEEKTRLKQHCHYFRQVMEETDMAGRKLGFVSQEIGREINTIGSKANHADIQKLVVLMKDELEKIKEQLLNVL